MGTIRVLSPATESKVSQGATLPLPAGVAGRTIGFLDNNKANFDLLTQHMEALLREHHGLAGVVRVKKANASIPAPIEVLVRLAGVDLVVTGSAD